MKLPRLLTTGDVAKLCGFSPSAVLQWIRAGKLSAFSSPRGQHRVDPADLLTFLKENNMRVPPELSPEDKEFRILIVDDDESIHGVLKAMLLESRIPCKVDVALNGVIGCMKIPIFAPHLIVLDLVMPELDGVEMCRSVKGSQEFGDTKVLLITGYADDERLREAIDAGADDWIAKPVKTDQFMAKVAKVLGLKTPAV